MSINPRITAETIRSQGQRDCSCVSKETVNLNIVKASTSSDRKIIQPITNEYQGPVRLELHLFYWYLGNLGKLGPQCRKSYAAQPHDVPGFPIALRGWEKFHLVGEGMGNFVGRRFY